MRISAGTRIGPYEIRSQLGEGGMGIVFAARDTNLQRDVAIKILPDHFAADPDRIARFEREAQVLASLNHPNIAQIYGAETAATSRCIVLELVEGETLQERLRRGAIPVEEALPIAKQIAGALEAAHGKGIVHRDLKPANVKITPAGTVKVLDFGLAKACEVERSDSNFSQSPTLLSGTMGGLLLGTAAYMSPEQARGQAAGDQSDIWSFGVVLYEMLTGKQPFTGDTITDVLAEIVRVEPDWSALPNTTPLEIRSLLRHCLQKNRAARLHHMGDARIEIEAAMNDPSIIADAPHRHIKPRRPFGWIAAAIILPLLLTAVLAQFVVAYYGLLSRDIGSIRFSIPPPDTAQFGIGPTAPYISLSPDGHHLAFVGLSDGATRLWVRSFDSIAARPLPGTEGVSTAASATPFWSPDSRFLAFFGQGKLKKIDTTGGPPQTLCDAEGSSGTWNREGVIVIDGGGAGGPLRRVSDGGGKPEPITALDQSRKDLAHLYPHFLPDGDHFLFLSRTDVVENNSIMIGSLTSKEVKVVMNVDSRAVYDRSGYLMFAREQSVMAVPFDAKNLTVTGAAFPVVEPVRYNPSTGAASITVSENGVLAYRGGEYVGASRLTWFDRSGKTLGTVGDAATYANLELSPDGKKVALEKFDPQTQVFSDIWIVDTTREVISRLTFDSVLARGAVWSPTGLQIIFTSSRNEAKGLYVKPSAGGGNEELVLKTAPVVVWDWSTDGKFVLFGNVGPREDLSVLPMSGNRMPFVYLPKSAFYHIHAQFSPDGKWVAYASNESNRSEVYIQSFPVPSAKLQVSVNGGTAPRWRRDGKEIFYLAPDQKLMAVSIQSTATAVELSTPVPLFQTSLPTGAVGSRTSSLRQQYDVTSDGQRFLVNALVEQSLEAPITVITNWTSGLKKPR